MGINVCRRKEFTRVNSPKVLFLGLLLLSLMGTIVWSQKKEITISIDNQEKKIVTFSRKAGTIVANSGVEMGDKDRLSVDDNSALKDGDKISVIRAVNVDLNVGGDETQVATSEESVGKFLAAEGIQLGEYDRVTPALDENIQAGMDIKVTRVEKIKELQEVAIDYDVVEKKNSKMAEEDQQLITRGRPGQKVVYSEATYEDGKIVKEVVLSQKMVKNPVSEVVEVGTIKSIEASNGQKIYYSKAIDVKATAYTGDFGPNGVRDDPYAGKTAVGTWAKRNPDGISTIAVDPRVIPLGTKVYVEGYGLAIAEDVGGAIKGNRIDVYYHKYYQTTQWGVRYVKVYIVETLEK